MIPLLRQKNHDVNELLKGVVDMTDEGKILSLRQFNERAPGVAQEQTDPVVLFSNYSLEATAEEGHATGISDGAFQSTLSGVYHRNDLSDQGVDMVIQGSRVAFSVPEGEKPEVFAKDVLDECGLNCKSEVTDMAFAKEMMKSGQAMTPEMLPT